MWFSRSTFHTTRTLQANSEMTCRTWFGGLCWYNLIDLSKVYDCLSHNLLISTLEAYGLVVDSLNFLLDCLNLRKHRTKIGSSYSKWSEFCWGIPQGSILDPLWFNVFIKDTLFFVAKSEICNFADDNTIYIHVEKIFLKLKRIWHVLWKTY